MTGIFSKIVYFYVVYQKMGVTKVQGSFAIGARTSERTEGRAYIPPLSPPFFEAKKETKSTNKNGLEKKSLPYFIFPTTAQYHNTKT